MSRVFCDLLQLRISTCPSKTLCAVKTLHRDVSFPLLKTFVTVQYLVGYYVLNSCKLLYKLSFSFRMLRFTLRALPPAPYNDVPPPASYLHLHQSDLSTSLILIQLHGDIFNVCPASGMMTCSRAFTRRLVFSISEAIS